VSRDAQLALRFNGARMIARPVVMGPLAVECDVPGVPGLLLAGDAAGFIDPMTGDGLRFALRGAELAAAEALRAIARGTDDAHLRLRTARRRAFARKWRFNTMLRSLVDMPSALGTAARAAALAPAWLRYTIRYAGDLHAA
jgi:flavin-dependent dehydrogenase